MRPTEMEIKESGLTLPPEKFIEYIVEKAKDAAIKEVDARDQSQQRRSTVIWSILGFIGFGAVVGVAQIYIGASTNEAVATAFEKQKPAMQRDLVVQISSSVTGDLRKEINDTRLQFAAEQVLQNFLYEVERLDRESGKDKAFSDATRDAVMAAALEAAKQPSLLQRSAFKSALPKMIQPFVAAGQETQIDKLDSALGELLCTQSACALRLSDHYGELAMSLPPQSAEFRNALDRQSRYLNFARHNRYPEKALAWKLFIAFRKSNFERNEEVDELVEQVEDLKDIDRAGFFRELEYYRVSANWQRHITQQGRVLERIVAGILKAYPALAAGLPTDDEKKNITHASNGSG